MHVQVTTSQFNSNFKPEVVCLKYPFSKLEGLKPRPPGARKAFSYACTFRPRRFHIMSTSFMCVQVTTSRSKSNFKPEIVCLEDPLSKLEGLGTKTITRLQDVQRCVEEHNMEDELPDVPNNRIETGKPHE